MANSDYQAQLTALYGKLQDIESKLSKLALISYVNTIQSTLTTSLNNLSGKVNTLTGDIQNIQLQIADILTELRSK